MSKSSDAARASPASPSFTDSTLKTLDRKILGDELTQFLVVVDDQYPIHQPGFYAKRPAGVRFYTSLRKLTVPIHFCGPECRLLEVGRGYCGEIYYGILLLKTRGKPRDCTRGAFSLCRNIARVR